MRRTLPHLRGLYRVCRSNPSVDLRPAVATSQNFSYVDSVETFSRATHCSANAATQAGSSNRAAWITGTLTRPTAAEGHTHLRTFSTASKPTGLYGYPELTEPKGFRILFAQAKAEIEASIRDIYTMPPSVEVIRAMDEISNTIGLVGDAAELCRNTHSDPEFVMEASVAHSDLFSYVSQLNADRALYDALLRAIKTKPAHIDDEELEEAYRVGESLLLDMELGGVHLNDEDKTLATGILDTTSMAEMNFGQNLTSKRFNYFSLSRKRLQRLNGMPMHLQQLVRPAGIMDDSARVHVNKSLLGWILSSIDDEQIRKEAYVAQGSWPQENMRELDTMLATRHELAKLVGEPSFAHLKTHMMLSQHPEPVMRFLDDLSSSIRPQAEAEMAYLQKIKRRYNNSHVADTRIFGWDESRYRGMANAKENKADLAAVREYLSLDTVLQGLSHLIERLFSCTVRQVSMLPGESWVPGEAVKKLEVTHVDRGLLGHVYLDLYPRPGKFTHAAHFTIRCGRALPGGGGRQAPLVALVCNFSAAREGAVPHLSFHELEVFFHEFGHAMHSILGATHYQQLSGNRTMLDFVEVPSILMEYFAADPRVLQLFARHKVTGDPIPTSLVTRLVKNQKTFQALDMQAQIVHSIMDQNFHGMHPPGAGGTTDALAEIQNKHSLISYTEGTSPQLQFGHFINYPASYYSYLFSRSIAATTWKELFEADPLDPCAGGDWYMKVLQYGGARHPASMFRDLISTTDVFKETTTEHQGGGGNVGYFPNTKYLMEEIANQKLG